MANAAMASAVSHATLKISTDDKIHSLDPQRSSFTYMVLVISLLDSQASQENYFEFENGLVDIIFITWFMSPD